MNPRSKDRRSNGRLASRFLPAMIAALLSFPSFADVLHMKDGREIEGEVVENNADSVVLKTPFGKQSFPKADIRRIEKRESAAQAYKKKLDALKRDDLAAVLDLAAWAKNSKLAKESKDLFELAIKLDPENETAHRELGHVRTKDGWFAKSEIEKQTAADNQKKGLVKYKGEWVSPEDKEMLEKGYKKVDGKWQSEEDEKAAKGLVKLDGKWVSKDDQERRRIEKKVEDALAVTPRAALTNRFQLVTLDDEARTKAMADFCEEVTGNAGLLLEGGPKAVFWIGRAHVYVLNTRNTYQDFVTTILTEYVTDPEGRKRSLRSTGSISAGLTPPFACALIETDKPFQPQLAHWVAHFVTQQFVRRPVPSWLDEGVAEYFEVLKYGESVVRCTTKTTYGDQAGEIADKASSSKNWKELLKESVESGEDTPLERMRNLDLNTLDFLHLSKAWSIVTWWNETRKPQFVTFMKLLREKSQEEAIPEAFGLTIAEMDAEWRNYVKQNYK